MIDPSKLIRKRMTEEDMSLMFLAGSPLVFKRIEDFENWLFILNFPLMSKYVDLVEVNSANVVVKFNIPFEIRYGKGSSVRFDYINEYNDDGTKTIKRMSVNKNHPEARLLIKASRR